MAVCFYFYNTLALVREIIAPDNDCDRLSPTGIFPAAAGQTPAAPMPSRSAAILRVFLCIGNPSRYGVELMRQILRQARH